MTRPMNQFGGWLRLFQVLAWANALASVAAIAFSGYTLLHPDEDFTTEELVSYILEALVYGPIVLKIALDLPRTTMDTPQRMLRCAGLAFMVTAAFALVTPLVVAANHGGSFGDHFDAPHNIFWLLVFWMYLQKSKRVLAAYGVNAGGFRFKWN
jgi:hypothetical protein